MGYQSLDVWMKSRRMARLVYDLTEDFPESDRFGLTAQIRRAVVSVPSNIAEGYGRNSPRAFASFLRTAKGSLNELETLLMSSDFGYIRDTGDVMNDIAKLSSMLTNFVKKHELDSVKEEISGYLDDSVSEAPLHN